jgi:hypothetical protein
VSDFQAIADRVEIEALRGEFTDAAMRPSGVDIAGELPMVSRPSP